MEALGDSDQLAIKAKMSSPMDRELKALQDTSPLVDVVEPLVKKVIAGISGMGKVVGSSTPTSEVTPDLIAAANIVKERCDKEILLPLLEMNEHINARRKELNIMYENQMEQLKALQKVVAKLKEKRSAINENAEIVGANATSLAQRSGSVLQSSTDLLPKITQAEFDYFQELKRLDAKTKDREQELSRLKLKVSTLCDAIEHGTTAGQLHLPPTSIKDCTSLLKASDKMMAGQRERLKEAEERADELAAIAGFDRNPDAPVGILQ